jgi:hypothetical protein
MSGITETTRLDGCDAECEIMWVTPAPSCSTSNCQRPLLPPGVATETLSFEPARNAWPNG